MLPFSAMEEMCAEGFLLDGAMCHLGRCMVQVKMTLVLLPSVCLFLDLWFHWNSGTSHLESCGSYKSTLFCGWFLKLVFVRA